MMVLKNVYQLHYQEPGQTRAVVEYVYAADEESARSKLAARHPAATIKDNVFEYSGASGFLLGSLGGSSTRTIPTGTNCTTTNPVYQRSELRIEDVLTKADLAELEADA